MYLLDKCQYHHPLSHCHHHLHLTVATFTFYLHFHYCHLSLSLIVAIVTLHSHCHYFHPSPSLSLFSLTSLAPTASPTNFVISSVNSTALSLAWNPPPQEHRNGLIIKYTLTCYETVNGSSYLVKSPVFPYTVNNNNSSVDLVLNGFRPGTIINCSVTASNEAGTGPAAHDDAITQEEGE